MRVVRIVSVSGDNIRIVNAWVCLAVALGLSACSDGTGPATHIRSIRITPGRVLATEVGHQVQFSATAWDENQSVINDATFIWETLDPAIVSIDQTGLATGLTAGVAVVRAHSGAVSEQATFEVYLDPHTGPFVAGQSYSGRRDYIEYLPGTLPVIISAPHGGDLHPTEIADRSYGVTDADRNTNEMAFQTRDSIFQHTGRYPHVIVSHLHRSKLDPNREIIEAAQGDIFAQHAWEEFHAFVRAARDMVETAHALGLYLDFHGHGHSIQRIELGYLLTAVDLAQPDAVLNGAPIINKSSIRSLASTAPASMAELVRGPQSFGTMLEDLGFPAVPSMAQPDPAGEPYFTGGYNTQQYGSRDGGLVSGFQVEAYFEGVRDTATNRGLFAAAMTASIEEFLLLHFGFDWTAALPGTRATGR